MHLRAIGCLGKQGLTELFFESSEPSLDEVPLADFLGGSRPENMRSRGGRSRGKGSKATFTHVIPAGPVIVSPQEGDEVDPANLVISWETVTNKLEGSGAGELVIVAYQVIVERADNDELGAAPRIFDIKLPASSAAVQSVTIPPEFLKPDTEYEFEVLAIEAGGNQTITEGGPFVTAAP